MKEYEDTKECTRKEPTEQQACDWFNDLSENLQDEYIQRYYEFERLQDDEQCDWFKLINTNSISFGNFVLEYYYREVVEYVYN
jgi:hypothetical protein